MSVFAFLIETSLSILCFYSVNVSLTVVVFIQRGVWMWLVLEVGMI